MSSLRGALLLFTAMPIARGPASAGEHEARTGHAPVAGVGLVGVGLVVGAAWVAGAFSLLFAGQFAVVAAFVLVADATVTGGRHLQAMARVADGDRPGAGGAVVAVVLALLLRFALLISAVGTTLTVLGVPLALRLVIVPLTGRAAMVALLALLPPEPDGELTQVLRRPGLGGLAATVVTVAVAAVLLTGLRGVLGVGLALLASGLYAAWWQRRRGVLTLDGLLVGGLLAETVLLTAIATT